MAAPAPAPCLVRRALCLGAFLTLAGCSTVGEKPSKVKATIKAGPDINPTPSGQAAPTMVRLYTLRNDTAFMQADFFSLTNQPAEVLGEELLDKREYMMVPGGKQAVELQMPPEAGFLGVTAGFREIDTARWRALVLIEPHSENMVDVSIAGTELFVRSALYKTYGWL
ncbi:type VI secretion system lipoprotein TssJ [Xanthobacter sp. TB0139]|uniref:type VI secretion system lipoprotein TssJ n=1 Tax=Xanthobacter sp. TB0139 TaxID=3459178 RepID=UPI004039D2BD